MKFLFSAPGLILILVVLAVIFWPRRLPDAAKKVRKSMRAFPDEDDDESPASASESGVASDAEHPPKG
jgi:Sec-independent protein translocase protein TatA